jgi:UDP-glucuronate 4-epimerase
MRRDFTYIDDIIEGVARVMDKAPAPDPLWNGVDHKPESSYAPYRIYNIGNNQPESIMRMVEILETSIGKKAIKKLLPMQAGDMKETAADITRINRDFGFTPSTPFDVGVKRFVEWYRGYYKV